MEDFMAEKKTIGFICGSLRDGSINRQLTGALSQHYEDAGFDCRMIDLHDYPLPIYNGDLDQPGTLRPLMDAMNDCDGIVIVTPEYNGGLPALVKNTIDWITTVDTEPFTSNVFGVAACTPGPLSGVVCMRTMALLLMRIGGRVCPTFVGIGNASSSFDAEGRISHDLGKDLTDKQIADMKRLLG